MTDPAHPPDHTPSDDILNGQIIYLKRGHLNRFGFEPAWNSYFDFYLSTKYLEKPILQLADVTFHLWLRKNLNDDDPTWQMPSIRVMKRKFGISQDKIDSMLDRLTKARLLKKVSGQGSGDKGANVTNTYELSDPIQNLEDFLVVAREGRFSQPLKAEWQPQEVPPVPEIGTGALPKIGTPPVPEIGTHKHTSNIKQTTRAIEKSNNNSGGEGKQGVVVALTKKGISETVANRLASRHKEARIYEKIDYLDYLLETASDKVKNPRGWLRRAIEENYGPPDGYRSKEQREQAAVEQKQRSAHRQSLVDAYKQQEAAEQAAAEAELLKKREAALTTYSTRPELVDLWEQTLLPRLQSPVGLKGSLLVKLDNTQAMIWLPNNYVRNLVEQKHLKDIYKVLAKHLQVDLPKMKVELVCPGPDEAG